MLSDIINLNYSKSAKLEFYQLHIQIYQFQSRYSILSQNTKESKLL